MTIQTALVLFLLLATLLPSFAQESTAEVTGRITDSSGSVAPNAAVEIRNAETGVRWQAMANADGYYTQPLLPPGEYRMTVRLEGFKQARRTVTLAVDQVARLDFVLELGAVSESVEVSGAAPLLESSTASIGQVVETQMINDMPLMGETIWTWPNCRSGLPNLRAATGRPRAARLWPMAFAPT
jgi:hypothetical protein